MSTKLLLVDDGSPMVATIRDKLAEHPEIEIQTISVAERDQMIIQDMALARRFQEMPCLAVQQAAEHIEPYITAVSGDPYHPARRSKGEKKRSKRHKHL